MRIILIYIRKAEDPVKERPSAAPLPQPRRSEIPHQESHRWVLASEQIFAGTDTVDIDHHGKRYTLRRTRQGKLLLTR